MVLVAASRPRQSHIPGPVGRRIVAEQHEGAKQYLVLDGRRARHRVRIIDTGVPQQGFEYRIPADPHIPERLLALSAFVLGAGSVGTFLPTPYRRHRLVRLLAILDLVDRNDADGSLLRRIAAEILSARTTKSRAIDWKSSGERRQAQRLLAEARRTAGTGYRNLLAGQLA
ncbi:DNA -binding domain-containing protein [Porphyrobacter sp. TH134]|uniref:DNA -binding domain-containing protein n=1 Tax=Porphyrobacter sp. TH134 TaxID=2067450 RepID=UPI001F3D3154|nr:DUF2285 domain-containing protein [Porphyrobacter sp. TH134]